MKKLQKVIVTILIILLYIGTGGLIVPILLLGMIIYSMVTKYRDSKKNLNAIENLPTSQVAHAPMGLAEIKGKLEPIDLVNSPIAKPCIGYWYQIEEVTKDEKGGESFTLIHSEQKCNPFYLKDKSGKIRVDPEGLQFMWGANDYTYSSDAKRYNQRSLSPGATMLMVGEVALNEHNETIFKRHDELNIFSISDVKAIDNYIAFKPLWSTFKIYLYGYAFILSIILMISISLTKAGLAIQLPEFSFSWFNESTKTSPSDPYIYPLNWLERSIFTFANDNSGLVVMGGTIGFLIISCIYLFKLYNKIKTPKSDDVPPIIAALGAWIAITVVGSMLTLIPFLQFNINGIKLLFIWIFYATLMWIFSYTNKDKIHKELMHEGNFIKLLVSYKKNNG